MQPLNVAERIDGWMSRKELEWIRSAALSRQFGVVAVEIGSWLGRSTVAMATDTINLTCVDNWQGGIGILSELSRGRNIYKEFLENMQRLALSPGIVRMDAFQAASRFPGGFIDWIFLDCDKSLFPRQFWAWYPKLKIGGLYSGHDFSPEFPAVKETLDAAQGMGAFEYHVVPETSIWWFIKR